MDIEELRSHPLFSQKNLRDLHARCRSLRIEPHPAEVSGEPSPAVVLPSFSPPPPLTAFFLTELNEQPLLTCIRIAEEADLEMKGWTEGCCQYLGSFLELNAATGANLRQCHLNRTDIEACIRLLYLSAVVRERARDRSVFLRLVDAALSSFPSTEDNPVSFERQFTDWQQILAENLQSLQEKREQPESGHTKPSGKLSRGCLPAFALSLLIIGSLLGILL